MKSETQTKDVLFMDLFARIKTEIENVTEFKNLVYNPFELDFSLEENVILKGHFIKMKLEMVATHETPNLVIYCGLKIYGQATKIMFVYVNKKAADYQQFETFVIDDEVISRNLGLIYTKDKPAISYIIGTSTGTVKIFSIGDKPTTTKMKVHTIPVKYIEIAQSNEAFNHRSIALVMCQDQTIFLVNLEKLVVIGQYKCGIIPSRNPLKVLFHSSHQYFLQASDDGCLHFWELSEESIQKIKQSQEQEKLKVDFKKSYGIIPTYEVHSAATSGIIDCAFLGNFVLLLTSDNTLKMIAFDRSVENTYFTIFIENIEDYEQPKLPLNLRKMEIVHQLRSIFVMSDTKLFMYTYNQYGIIRKKVFSFEGLSSLENFSITKESLLMITGSNAQGVPQIFIQKIKIQKDSRSVSGTQRGQQGRSSRPNNFLIN